MALSREAYERAVRKWHRPLLRYFMATTRLPQHDAEDLVYRSFEALWRRREQFDPAVVPVRIEVGKGMTPETGLSAHLGMSFESSVGSSVEDEHIRAWLFGMALQERRHFLRAHARQNAAFARLLEHTEATRGPESDPTMALLPAAQHRLNTCLQQLKSLDREILLLFYGVASDAATLSTHSQVATVASTAQTAEPEAPSQRPIQPALGDRAIAERLATLTGQIWQIARVKMTRHRAILRLRHCLLGKPEDEPRSDTPSSETIS